MNAVRLFTTVALMVASLGSHAAVRMTSDGFSVDTTRAMNTPLEQSSQRIEQQAAGQALAREQQLEQTQATQRSLHA